MLRKRYLWRKRATPDWWQRQEPAITASTGGSHAVIERPGRALLVIEMYFDGLPGARVLLKDFGGAVIRLPADWEKRLFSAHQIKPLRIGRRLMVRSDGTGKAKEGELIIPAAAAFGTGEHATTAMSLRILERLTRRRAKGWRMLDAGTGSGILALAARRFGAGEVIALDNDPLAIKTAKWNARANRIRGVEFQVADVTQAISGRFDIIAANLYSELLVTVLPRFRRCLRRDGRLILSGIMRAQERELTRALRRNGFRILETRRRGKWIALLALASSSEKNPG